MGNNQAFVKVFESAHGWNTHKGLKVDDVIYTPENYREQTSKGKRAEASDVAFIRMDKCTNDLDLLFVRAQDGESIVDVKKHSAGFFDLPLVMFKDRAKVDMGPLVSLDKEAPKWHVTIRTDKSYGSGSLHKARNGRWYISTAAHVVHRNRSAAFDLPIYIIHAETGVILAKITAGKQGSGSKLQKTAQGVELHCFKPGKEAKKEEDNGKLKKNQLKLKIDPITLKDPSQLDPEKPLKCRTTSDNRIMDSKIGMEGKNRFEIAKWDVEVRGKNYVLTAEEYKIMRKLKHRINRFKQIMAPKDYKAFCERCPIKEGASFFSSGTGHFGAKYLVLWGGVAGRPGYSGGSLACTQVENPSLENSREWFQIGVLTLGPRDEVSKEDWFTAFQIIDQWMQDDVEKFVLYGTPVSDKDEDESTSVGDESSDDGSDSQGKLVQKRKRKHAYKQQQKKEDSYTDTDSDSSKMN